MCPRPDTSDDPGSSRSQIRGSSLLLVGRLIALGLAFAAQVLTVRYLSKSDYGVFAYALSLVTFGESLSLLGLDRAVARFLPLYDERGQRHEALGVIVMVLGTISGLGSAYILIMVAFSGPLTANLDGGSTAAPVLMLLAALGPLQAFDRLGTSLLAIYTSPRAIFFRKYLLGPGLRLLAVLAVLGTGAGVVAMSLGYLIGGVLGVVLYGIVLVRALKATGALRGTSRRSMQMPWREILAFSLPLLTTDLVFSTMTSIDGVMLGSLRGADEVAALRAVQPVARLNQLVMASFGVLFTPAAARLFARGDGQGINDLYWRTASWVAILSFPLFVVTFLLADPITTTFFGADYAESGQILALLSLGFFLTAALGFNGMVLNVYGRIRDVVILNLVAAAVNVSLNLVLIPLDGARGAATATMCTFAVHNLLKQWALGRGTDINPTDRAHRGPYQVLLAATAVVVVVRLLLAPGPLVAAGVSVVVVVGVMWATRSSLQVADTFPEIARLPGVGRLFGGRR